MAVKTKTKTKTKTKVKVKVKVSPLDDRVLVKPDEAEEKTSGGIYLPDAAREKPIHGIVVGVGPGRLLDDGKRAPMSVKVGDNVIYGKYAGSEVKIDAEEHSILRETDILGILEE